jgi:hypothetical protein
MLLVPNKNDFPREKSFHKKFSLLLLLLPSRFWILVVILPLTNSCLEEDKDDEVDEQGVNVQNIVNIIAIKHR